MPTTSFGRARDGVGACVWEWEAFWAEAAVPLGGVVEAAFWAEACQKRQEKNIQAMAQRFILLISLF